MCQTQNWKLLASRASSSTLQPNTGIAENQTAYAGLSMLHKLTPHTKQDEHSHMQGLHQCSDYAALQLSRMFPVLHRYLVEKSSCCNEQ